MLLKLTGKVLSFEVSKKTYTHSKSGQSRVRMSAFLVLQGDFGILFGEYFDFTGDVDKFKVGSSVTVGLREYRVSHDGVKAAFDNL